MIVITVARKPISGAVTENVIQWGTGVLNIDACRISCNSGEYDIRHYTNEDCFTSPGKEKKSKFQVKPQPSGRWPANVILEHNPECQSAGVAEIRPLEEYRPNPVNVQADGNIQFSKKPPGYQKISYTNDNGMETIEQWECVGGCPVRELNRQSGNRPGMPVGTGPKEYGGGGGFDGMLNRQPHPGFGDSGGASRFFKQVQK